MNHNPLQQYFRRPVMYLRLPSGGNFYPPGAIDMPPNQELPVYSMTAVDEITSRTPDALFNGAAVVSIIQSCVPSIKDAWQVNSVDLDAILIAIRIASSGDEMDIESRCPSCGEEHRYGFNLVNLLASQKSIDYEQSLPIRELKIKFRPLKYAEINNSNITQYHLQKALVDIETIEDEQRKKTAMEQTLKSLNSAMTDIVAATIQSITTPEEIVTDNNFIREFLENCDRITYNTIKEYSINLKNQNSLKPLDLTCNACSHQYQQSVILNVSDFFD